MWGTDAVLPGAPNANGGPEYYVSRRGADGWSDKPKPVGPPGNEVTGASSPMYASPNLDRIIWFTFGASLQGDDGPFNEFFDFSNDFYREEPDGTFVHLNQGSVSQPSEDLEGLFPRGIGPDGMEMLFGDARFLEPEATQSSLYLGSGNTTKIVSRDENNVPVTYGDARLSEDGSTAAFVASDGRVWIRDLDADHSTLVSSAATPGFSGEAVVSVLSTDGTRLILNTTGQLTPDDEDSSVDLYEYNSDTESLTRLSTGSPGSGNANACGGGECSVHFLTATKDGSEVYFTSPERLDGSKGVAGSPNLYLHKGGQTIYVTTLAPDDHILAIAEQGHRFRLTPDQSTLLFEAGSRITAYDSVGHNEIYAYDSSTGRVTCVSCRPDGTAPSGEAGLREGPVQTSAAFPAFARIGLNLVNSDADGLHYFFHTADALVPEDTNGSYDVYEYDVASATPLLISSGKGESFAAFWGNSRDGRDVFFATGGALSPEDASVSALKVYDARIGGGFPIPVKPAPCEGEGCRGQGSALPPPATPTTPSFEGPGNPKPSKGKKHKKKHQKRKSQGKKRHGHKRTASTNGRTGR